VLSCSCSCNLWLIIGCTVEWDWVCLNCSLNLANVPATYERESKRMLSQLPFQHSPEKTMANFSQDSQPPGRKLNPEPPTYEARMLTTHPWCSVMTYGTPELAMLCKSDFLDFVHRLHFNKITMFQKLDLLPSSGKKRKDRNPSCWVP
jgi:hypothetical protein